MLLFIKKGYLEPNLDYETNNISHWYTLILLQSWFLSGNFFSQKRVGNILVQAFQHKFDIFRKLRNIFSNTFLCKYLQRAVFRWIVGHVPFPVRNFHPWGNVTKDDRNHDEEKKQENKQILNICAVTHCGVLWYFHNFRTTILKANITTLIFLLKLL